MTRKLLPSILIIMALSFSGCSFTEKVSNTAGTVGTEIGEAYNNVVTKINNTKEWIVTKLTQAEKAADDIQDATDSVNEALDSVKDLTDMDNSDEEESEEETSETTE